MSQPLVDPQLEAFYGSDPARFLEEPPEEFHAPEVPDPHLAVALELAVAFLVVRGLMAKWLQAQQPRVSEVQYVSGQAWANHAPIWLRVAVPAIKQAYTLGAVEGLTEDELTEMATDYATSLGDYLATTSGDALLAGFTEQLNGKWDAGLAWHRAAEAYGVDRQQMRAYVKQVTSGAGDQADPIPAASRALIDKALLSRAAKMGETESWRATQSGKSLAWMILQANGTIPANAQREWDAADEAACPICSLLHGQRVALREPFIDPTSGARIWAPGMHPGCRCNVELYIPPAEEVEAEIGKAYDPNERRDASGRWSRTEAPARQRRGTLTRVQDPTIERIMSEVANAPAPTPTEGIDLFGSSQAGPGEPRNLFAEAKDLFSTPGQSLFQDDASRSLFDQRKRPVRHHREIEQTGRAHKRVVRHIFLPQKQRPADHEPYGDRYYIDARSYHEAFEEYPDVIWDPGDIIDFTEANDSLEAMASWGAHEMQGTDVHLVAVKEEDPLKLDPDTREQHWAPEDLVRREWDVMLPQLRAAHQDALTNVTDVVQRLHSQSLASIMRLAGYDWSEDNETIRDRIIRAVHGGIGSDTSLAGAYADWVAWTAPELLGDDGFELARQLDELENNEIYVHQPAQNQFFVFENGFHPGNEREGRHWAPVDRNYLATYATYHSMLGEKGSGAEPFVIGWREISMEPYIPEDDDSE